MFRIQVLSSPGWLKLYLINVVTDNLLIFINMEFIFILFYYSKALDLVEPCIKLGTESFFEKLMGQLPGM
jgi:hypothetical protein